MVYFGNQIVIVDPDYQAIPGSRRRVTQFAGLAPLRELLNFMIKGKGEKVGGETCCGRAIHTISIGHTGFGRPRCGMCTKMCGQWVQSFIQAGCPVSWFDGWEVLGR